MAASDSELAIMRLAWRLDALDQWRKDVDKWCGAMDTRVGDLTRADEIADAIAVRVHAGRTLGLTALQKAIVIGAALIAAAGGLKGLIT